jgi:hypothetical protein
MDAPRDKVDQDKVESEKVETEKEQAEKVESTNTNQINEKVKNKLKEYTEFKCLYNLSNAAVRFKRNLSLIVRERVEKNLNINRGKNDYYSSQNPSTDVFKITTLFDSVFGEYVKRNNIDIPAEVQKMEADWEEKRQQMGKNKIFASNAQKKNKTTKKDPSQANESGSDNKKKRRNYALYVINDNRQKKPLEINDKLRAEGANNNQIVIINSKRKNVPDKPDKNDKEIKEKEKEKEKEDTQNKNKEDETKNDSNDEKENNNPENDEINKENKNTEKEENNDTNNKKEEKEEEKQMNEDNSKQDIVIIEENNKENDNSINNNKELLKEIMKETINKEKIKEKNQGNYTESTKELKWVNQR